MSETTTKDEGPYTLDEIERIARKQGQSNDSRMRNACGYQQQTTQGDLRKGVRMSTYIDSDNIDQVGTLPSSKALDALFNRYELTAAQYAEQKQLGYADGSTGQANRYKGDTTQLGRAYQAGWHAGLNAAMSDINDTCIEP